MKKHYILCSTAMVLFLFCFGLFSTPANAGLIGDEIFASGDDWLTPVSAIIGAGPEFTWPSFAQTPHQFDFADSTLSIIGEYSAWSGHGDFIFSGFDDTILGFSVASNTGYSGTIVDNFSLTESSITLDMSSGSCRGGVLVFDIATTTVPEPSTMILLGFGLLCIVVAKRKKFRNNR